MNINYKKSLIVKTDRQSWYRLKKLPKYKITTKLGLDQIKHKILQYALLILLINKVNPNNFIRL